MNKPGLHSQLYDPIVLVQIALSPHMTSNRHSLISKPTQKGNWAFAHFLQKIGLQVNMKIQSILLPSQLVLHCINDLAVMRESFIVIEKITFLG